MVCYSDEHDHLLAKGSISLVNDNDELAIILNYMLPVVADGNKFGTAIFEDPPVVITENDDHKGWLLPIASMVHDSPGNAGDVLPHIDSTSSWGVAIAIPPDAPADYAMTGSSDGLGVTYYLGLTSERPTAHFQFIIFPVDPKWGFRSALNEYYEFFSEFYTPRTDQVREGGLWLWGLDYDFLKMRRSKLLQDLKFVEEIAEAHMVPDESLISSIAASEIRAELSHIDEIYGLYRFHQIHWAPGPDPRYETTCDEKIRALDENRKHPSELHPHLKTPCLLIRNTAFSKRITAGGAASFRMGLYYWVRA